MDLIFKDRSIFWASLVAQRLKCLLPMWETWVRSLGQEDPLEKEMATHCSILAWRIPWTEEPGRLQSMRSQRVRQDWATERLHFLSFTSQQKGECTYRLPHHASPARLGPVSSTILRNLPSLEAQACSSLNWRHDHITWNLQLLWPPLSPWAQSQGVHVAPGLSSQSLSSPPHTHTSFWGRTFIKLACDSCFHHTLGVSDCLETTSSHFSEALLSNEWEGQWDNI